MKTAIERTVQYGRKFGVEYGYKEIRERLISSKKYSDKKITVKLQELKLADFKRTDREILRNKVEKAERLGKRLAEKFQNILLVGITGSVAAGYPKRGEDIDLMVITKNNCLWLTRLGAKTWTWFNRIPERRYGAEQKKDDFCFNLWLEDCSLELPVYRQN